MFKRIKRLVQFVSVKEIEQFRMRYYYIQLTVGVIGFGIGRQITHKFFCDEQRLLELREET